MFKHAHAADSNWRSACQTVLTQLGSVPDGSGLGFIYAHHAFAEHLDAIIDTLRIGTGITHWCGTVGLGVCSTALEIYDQPSIAILATDIPASACHIIPSIHKDPRDAIEAANDWQHGAEAHFGVVHGDPGNQNIEQLILDLAQGMENGYLVGGLTSSEQTLMQVADVATRGGLSGVLLAPEVPVVTGLSQGCTLIGKRHQISGCRQNILSELDGRPAVEVMKEDIGEILARDLNRIAGYIFAALAVPNSDTGDYLVRNIIGLDSDNNLIGIGDLLQPNTHLQFAKRDAQTARDDLVQMIEKLKDRLPGEPKGALYHSCLGRGRHLFGEDSAELKLIAEHLGDLPLIGFYANGEISHNRLYGYTGVLTLFC